MASSKPSKRLHTDSDSDGETTNSTFPHFIVLESLQEKQLTKLNPFVIEKVISGIVNPVSVKKLQNGTLLVEVGKKAYADNLLKMNLFAGLKIKSFPHFSLNTSKGVVRSSELSLCTLDEIKTYLKNQGVSDVKRITINRNQETITTNTYIFTFNTSQVQKEIKVGYNLIKVNPYIPNPLRCYNCQKFGHHESKCLKPTVCKKCGESGSDHIELSCSNPTKCPNCQGNHTADSKDCIVWKREKEVNQIKYTNNISFPEARKIVQSKNLHPTKSYSDVTKSNLQNKQEHTCQTCLTILEKLVNLTPDNLPQLIKDLKSSLSDSPVVSSSSKPSTTTSPTHEAVTQVTPPAVKETPTSPVRQANRSPNRAIRQSPTPRRRIQLETTNTKNRFEVLESEESMECGELTPTPTPSTSKNVGQKPPQTPKPQRTKPHK